MGVTLTCAALAMSMLGARQTQPPVTATAAYAALVERYHAGDTEGAAAFSPPPRRKAARR